MLSYNVQKVSTMKGKSQKDIMKLTDFRTELTDTLCRYERLSGNKRGRPSTRREEIPEFFNTPRSGVQVLPSTDVFYDRVFMDSRNKFKYNNYRKHLDLQEM
ncbi:hypothetical protein NPIL_126081 [Nephila pilipes]|uniref:Uncharacterized protein n=1 Tax=Nephila pilipes TaxID=299642 RepID=A0A8X6MSB4_NEPPI|nr:hypothetical protein NPIL_126081 [Nephila pilipes]